MITQDSTTMCREFIKRVGTVAGASLLLGQNSVSAHAESSQEGRPGYPSAVGINVLLI